MRALVAQRLSGPSGLLYVDVPDVASDDAVLVLGSAGGIQGKVVLEP